MLAILMIATEVTTAQAVTTATATRAKTRASPRGSPGAKATRETATRARAARASPVKGLAATRAATTVATARMVESTREKTTLWPTRVLEPLGRIGRALRAWGTSPLPSVRVPVSLRPDDRDARKPVRIDRARP